MPPLVCPPRPSRAGAAKRFRSAVEALERRVARLGGPGNEQLLAQVRNLRQRSEGYEEVTTRQSEVFRRLREREQWARPRT